MVGKRKPGLRDGQQLHREWLTSEGVSKFSRQGNLIHPLHMVHYYESKTEQEPKIAKQ